MYWLGDAAVELALVLEPFAEGHEDFDDIDEAGVLVEALDGGGELGELVAEGVDGTGVVAGVDGLEHLVDGAEELVDELGTGDVLGGALFGPAAGVDPAGDGLGTDAGLLGYDFLAVALHEENACVVFFFFELFSCGHSALSDCWLLVVFLIK